jgi:hypothetical protein
MATENLINDYFVTLSSSATSSAGSLLVSTAASVSGGFRILIDSELMLVTSGGTTPYWSVTRAIEGTTASPHNAGAAIHVVMTAGGILNLLATSVGLIQPQGLWSNATTYAQYTIVYWQGSAYISAVAANYNNQPDTSPSYWTLFLRAPTSKGTWSSAVTYQYNDIVIYNSTSYLSIVTSNYNNQPDVSPTYWQLLAIPLSTNPTGVGTYASIPNVGAAGQSYQCTDSPYTAIYNGSVWQYFAYGSLVTPPPLVSSLTWGNQGGATGVSTGELVMTAPTSSGDNLRCLFKSSYPTTPYTFTVGVQTNWPSANYFTSGIIVSDGTKYVVCGPIFSGTWQCWVGNYSSVTTNVGIAGIVGVTGWGNTMYLTVNDTGTNLTYWVSTNPYDLQRIQIYSASRTAYLGTPTKVGVFLDVNNTSYGAAAQFFHWTGI